LLDRDDQSVEQQQCEQHQTCRTVNAAIRAVVVWIAQLHAIDYQMVAIG
jgi:hypothetical protein